MTDMGKKQKKMCQLILNWTRFRFGFGLGDAAGRRSHRVLQTFVVRPSEGGPSPTQPRTDIFDKIKNVKLWANIPAV